MILYYWLLGLLLLLGRCAVVFCFNICRFLPQSLADYRLHLWTRPALFSANWAWWKFENLWKFCRILEKISQKVGKFLRIFSKEISLNIERKMKKKRKKNLQEHLENVLLIFRKSLWMFCENLKVIYGCSRIFWRNFRVYEKYFTKVQKNFF